MGPAGRPPVVDVALPSQSAVVPGAASRAKVIARLRLGDTAFRLLTKSAAVGVLIALLVVGGSSYFIAHGNEQLAQLLSRGDRA